MKAMIFAAGLGTRLKHLTSDRPKALVEINGIPLLELVIKKLKNAGFDNLIINVHHYADQIIHFLAVNNNFGAHIEISDERDQLLDTGGGLKKASWFLKGEKPFLVHNVDIISDINLNELYQYHLKKKPLATLAVKERHGSRFLLMNREDMICGWRNDKTSKEIIVKPKEINLRKIAFSGIHVIDPDIFNYINEQGSFSITNVYLRLASNYPIIGYEHPDSYWMDLGKPENLQEAERYLNDTGTEKFI